MADQDDVKAAEAAFAGGYDDKPTGRPAVEEPEAGAAAVQEEEAPKVDDQPAAEPAKPDPLADVIARMDKIQQSHDKLAGTLGRVQQTNEQLQAQLAAKAASAVADAPDQADIKRAVADPAEWASLKQEFPEWGNAFESLLEARMPKFDADAFEQKVNQAIEGKAATIQAKIIDASLNAVFPGWKQDVASPEFAAWLEAQPDDTKALRNSDDVGDAARVLKLYAGRTAPAAPAAQGEPKKDTSARKERFAAAVAPKGTGGHAGGRTELDEFEAGYSS